MIFKEADKGGTLVILNKTNYMSEMNHQLDMREYYLPISHDPTTHISNVLQVMINEALSLDYIDERTAAFFVNRFPKVPVFNILPKIHKEGNFPLVRLIISGC